jgi:hypothetical protein
LKRSKTVKKVERSEAFSKSRFTLSNKLTAVDITFVNEFYSNLNTKKSLTKTLQRKKIYLRNRVTHQRHRRHILLYRPQNTLLHLIKSHQAEKNQA